MNKRHRLAKLYDHLPWYDRAELYLRARLRAWRDNVPKPVPPGQRATQTPLGNLVIVISTFPFLFILMLMMTPSMIDLVVNAAPFVLSTGLLGILIARRRGIRLEDRFMSLMLIAFGVSAATFAPALVSQVVIHRLHPVSAASMLYGITLTLYLMLCLGLYGIVINFQRPQRYHMVGA